MDDGLQIEWDSPPFFNLKDKGQDVSSHLQ